MSTESAGSARKEKLSVLLTPKVLVRLLQFAARNRWSRSTAAAVLIERGLDADDAG